MSHLRDCAPFAIELQEIKFSAEDVPVVCDVAAAGKYIKGMKNSELSIFYCGDLIVFERPGYAAHGVSFSFVKAMVAFKDAEMVGSERKNIADAAKAKEILAKAAELEKKQKELEAYKAQKAAVIAAKMQNPNFSNAEVVAIKVEEAEDDAAADMAASSPAEVAAVVAEMSAAPVPPPVAEADMMGDMKSERGQMSDEEQRSMQAAIARSKKGRR